MAQLILNNGGGSGGGNGLSAYEVAVNNGFEGTEEEWLTSLKGKKGDKGDPFKYSDFTQEQLNALKVKGDKGDAFKYSDFTTEQLNSLKVKGDKGDAFKYSDFTQAQLDALKGKQGDAGFGTEAQYNALVARLNALENQVVPVTGISISKSELTIEVGKTETLTANISPSNATNKVITWSTPESGHADIASVDSSGKVTAKKIGTSKVRVQSKDGAKSAWCTVTVKAATIPVTGVNLDSSTLNLEVGQSKTLVAGVVPSNATNKNVTWTSDNTAVAKVDGNGKVTAVAKGSAKITAKTADGGKTAVCTATITEKPVDPPVEGGDE